MTLPRLYFITTEGRNTRVYGMDHDPQGTLWFTGSLPLLHRYWPREGRMESFPIPEGHGGSQCLWAAGHVFVLPQLEPQIVVFDVSTGRSRHIEKPFPEANLWYGRADKERGTLYLEERSRPCLAVFDVATERWQLEPRPAPGPPPEEGPRYRVSYADGVMTRLDRLTGETYSRAVPGWGEEFGFIGGGVFWRGWQLNNLSTYNNTYRYNEQTGEYLPLVPNPDRGVDGHPYHFMDRFLAYHPESDTFDRLVPDVPPGCYPQLCYSIVVEDELFITGNEIWSAEKGRALGASEGPVGRLSVLQSLAVTA